MNPSDHARSVEGTQAREAAVVEAIRRYEADEVAVEDLRGPCWSCKAEFGEWHRPGPCHGSAVTQEQALEGRLALETFRMIVADEATVWDLESLHAAAVGATGRALARITGADADDLRSAIGDRVRQEIGPAPAWAPGAWADTEDPFELDRVKQDSELTTRLHELTERATETPDRLAD